MAFRYYAFISYSHADKKAVTKMQKRIERFVIPRYIRKLKNLAPKKIGSIFRDDTDLAGVDLIESIRTALDESACLIVVCSRHSAKSQWVNSEIDYFTRTKETGRVIPVFVGKRNRISEEIMPEALLKKGFQASDVLFFNQLRSTRSTLEIVNLLLGLDRYTFLAKYMDRRFDIMVVGGVFLLFPLFLIVLLDVSWFFRDRIDAVKYFEKLTYHADWPVGVNELSSREIRRAENYYRFTYRSGRVAKVEHIKGSNVSEEIPGIFWTQSDCMNFFYDNNWGPYGYAEAKISKVIFRNARGEILFIKNYSLTNDVIDLNVSEESSEPYFLPADMTYGKVLESPRQFQTGDGMICRMAQIYDENGYLERVWYLSDTDSYYTCDKNGYFGHEYERDDAGNITALSYFDLDHTILRRFELD